MFFFVIFDFCCQSFIMKTSHWAMSLPRFEIFHCQKICLLRKSRTKSRFPSTPNLPQASHPPGRTASKSSPLSPKKQSMYVIPNTSMQQVPESRILKSRPLILLSLSYQSQGQGQVSVYKMVIGVNYHPSPSG